MSDVAQPNAAPSQSAAAGTTETPDQSKATAQPAVAPAPAPVDKASAPTTDASSEKSILDNAQAEGDKKTAAEGEAKPEGDAKKDGEAKKEGATAPDKYELKAPEGTTLNPADIEAFTPIAKELGLSNEAAQKLIDFEAQRLKTFNESQEANYRKFVADTKAETLKHYEEQQKAGGASMKESMVFVAKARNMFFTPALMEKLNGTGLANDKDLVIALEKVGRQISEDKLVEGSRRTNKEATAQDLYPSMKQN